MEVLYPHVELHAPSLHVIRTCNSSFHPTVASERFESGKPVEFSNELQLSAALQTLPFYSYDEADIVVFDSCPYSRFLGSHSDPFKLARQRNEMLPQGSKVVQEQRPCVYMALHPHSYPREGHQMRFCTALLEDKTMHGDESDVVVPSGAVTYPTSRRVDKTCTMTHMGSVTRASSQFGHIRKRIRDRMVQLNMHDACVATGDGEAYVAGIQRSKFCFALPGDTRGGEKLALFVMNGCVPIVEHFSWKYLPFHRYLNYSKFAVRLPRQWNLASLLVDLRRHEYYTSMSQELDKARWWFDYSRRGPISPHSLIWSEVHDVWLR